MVDSSFGKTTARPVGTVNVRQVDISGGLESLSRGIQAVGSSALAIAAVEEQKIMRQATIKGQQAGTAHGAQRTPEGKLIGLEIPPNVDLTTQYGQSFSQAAQTRYFAEIRADGKNKAEELKARFPENSAAYNEAYADYIEEVANEVPDQFAQIALADLTTIGRAGGADVLASEVAAINAETIAALSKDIDDSLEAAETAAIGGDFEAEGRHRENALGSLKTMLDAGYIKETEFETKAEGILLAGVVNSKLSPILQGMNMPGTTPAQQTLFGYEAISAMEEMTPQELGVDTEVQKRAVIASVQERVGTAASRKMQAVNQQISLENRQRFLGDQQMTARMAAGETISVEEALAKHSSGNLSSGMLNTIVSERDARVAAAKKQAVADLETWFNTGLITFSEATQSAIWSSMLPTERQSFIEKATKNARDAVNDKNAGKLEWLIQTQSIPIQDAEAIFREAEANGTLQPGEGARKFGAYQKALAAGPTKARLAQEGLSLLATGQDITQNDTLRAVDDTLRWDIGDSAHREAIGDLAHKNGTILPSTAQQLQKALRSPNPNQAQAGLETFIEICTTSAGAKTTGACQRLEKMIGKEDFAKYDELANRVDPRSPMFAEEMAKVQQEQANAARDKSAINRNIAKWEDDEDMTLEDWIDNVDVADLVDEAAGIFDGLEDQIAPYWYFAAQANPQLRAAIEGEQLSAAQIEDIFAEPPAGVQEELVRRVRQRVASDPRSPTERIMKTHVTLALTEIFNEGHFKVIKERTQDPDDFSVRETIERVEYRPGRSIVQSAARYGLPEGIEVTEQLYKDHIMVMLTNMAIPLPNDTNADTWDNVNFDLRQVRGSDNFEIWYTPRSGDSPRPLRLKDNQGRSFNPTINADFNATVQGQWYREQLESMAEGENPLALWDQIPILGKALIDQTLEFSMENYRKNSEEYLARRDHLQQNGSNRRLAAMDAY